MIRQDHSRYGFASVDHSSRDFCAFKGLVDAVGGVGAVEYAARDPATDRGPGGMHLFRGDEALLRAVAKYPSRPGQERMGVDGTSDPGRITRQQDFEAHDEKAIDQGSA